MSGFTNVTGLPQPSSAQGFLALLQTAVWRGVPFQVISTSVKVGRKLAQHAYPFTDGGWAEDMGRMQRTYSFEGFLIGDLAPAMQLLLNTACETAGPGLLIHPSIGAVNVALLSASNAIHKDHGRVIAIAFEFLEQGGTLFPTQYIATALAVVSAGLAALSGANSDLVANAAPASAANGAIAAARTGAVMSAFCADVALGGANPAGIIAMAAGLPPPDPTQTFGRYAYGSLATPLPAGTTVATLQASLATQRAAIATAAVAAVATAQTLSPASDVLDSVSAVVEAMRAGITDPAAQVQVLLNLAAFDYADGLASVAGTILADLAIVRDAMVAACRNAALVSLCNASAAYQPASYDDAANLRLSLTAALDAAITTAGDAGDDATFTAFTALRAAVILDLTTRGANLPSVVTVTTNTSLPALVLAQRLYQDASRADQIAAETGAPHPAFCPTSMQVLAF